MKTLLYLLIAVLINGKGFSQSKPKIQQLDVDRLYQKYKDKETVTLYFAGESLEANIKIEYNASGKPSAVIMYGPFYSSIDILSLIENLENQKKKAGYHYVSSGSCLIPTAVISADVSIYQKATQYAKYGYGSSFSLSTTDVRSTWFYFEVGDIKRKGNDKTEKFQF